MLCLKQNTDYMIGSEYVLTVDSTCSSGLVIYAQNEVPPADRPIPPLDAADISTVFGVAFSTVVLCFLVGRGIGSVLNFIRNAG